MTWSWLTEEDRRSADDLTEARRKATKATAKMLAKRYLSSFGDKVEIDQSHITLWVDSGESSRDKARMAMSKIANALDTSVSDNGSKLWVVYKGQQVSIADQQFR